MSIPANVYHYATAMSLLGSRANEMFWDMAKCGNLDHKLYKNVTYVFKPKT